ncbi:hypothetical protein B2J93_1548 [Marssonina coronariae]|uniref:N-acetyltransferase domain-containing protein n=1 Tax=Diplocarpon coronariae TaxID=2795749 RepID=A0A218Z4E2_9HELO|nr:hypothetical protein B2J93_1548 [Marssonina coronariae]
MSPSKSDIDLVPWDSRSEAHVLRLRQQRLTCGWGVEGVETSRSQLPGTQRLFLWLVLKPSHRDYAALLHTHRRRFPREEEPLADTARLTFPRRRSEPFVPIGHVALDVAPPGSAPCDRVGASNFFVSPALRGRELARQAVETTTALASRYARFLVAEVPVRDMERYERFGDGRPKFSLVDWYSSLGFRLTGGENRLVSEIDSEGRAWSVELVAMELDLRGHERFTEKSLL